MKANLKDIFKSHSATSLNTETHEPVVGQECITEPLAYSSTTPGTGRRLIAQSQKHKVDVALWCELCEVADAGTRWPRVRAMFRRSETMREASLEVMARVRYFRGAANGLSKIPEESV